MKFRTKLAAAVVAVAALTLVAAPSAQAAKPVPKPAASSSASPSVDYNINKYADKLNTWQVNNPTGASIFATLEIVNDDTGEVVISTFYVSSSSALSKNIVQPTLRNPGEVATLYVNGVAVDTAVAGEWDALFQSWQSPSAGYINIVTGETAKSPR